METPRLGHDYITPGVSPEVRSRASSPERIFHIDSVSIATRVQEGTPPLKYFLDNLNANSMAGADIRLPTFNGNGAEDPKQCWFLSEVVWMVRLVQNADLLKEQMITSLKSHVLDYFMKFYVVPPGTPHKTLEEIQVAIISEFKKPKSES